MRKTMVAWETTNGSVWVSARVRFVFAWVEVGGETVPELKRLLLIG